jgi:hypothetical protein
VHYTVKEAGKQCRGKKEKRAGATEQRSQKRRRKVKGIVIWALGSTAETLLVDGAEETRGGEAEDTAARIRVYRRQTTLGPDGAPDGDILRLVRECLDST